MTPADEGIAAARRDNADNASLAALARDHAETIRRRSHSILADIKNYPALFDPSDLDEIGHALEQLRRICGEAARAQGPPKFYSTDDRFAFYGGAS